MSVCRNRQSGHYNFRSAIPAHTVHGKGVGPSLGKGGTCLAHARLVPGKKGTRKIREYTLACPRPFATRTGRPQARPSARSLRTAPLPGNDASSVLLSGADRRLQRLAGGCDFAAVIMPAVAADVMRALEFTAVGTFRMCGHAQRSVAATHATTGRGGFSLGYSHGPGPLRSGSQPAGTPSWRYTGQLSIIEGGALTDHSHLRK